MGDWAKITATCETCGGTYDGTPSGLRRHGNTQKHRNAAMDNGADVIAEQDARAALVTPVVADDDNGIPQVTAPDEYAGIPGLDALYAERSEITAAIANRNKALKEAEAGLRWREKHNADNAALIAKWQEKVNGITEEIDLFDRRLGPIAVAIEEAREVRRAEVNAFWDGIAAEVDEHIIGGLQDFTWNQHRGTFNIFMTTGKVRTYKDGTEGPETRFGFEATVYAPSAYGETEFKVNWGTLGSQSVADARDMMRVHSLAIDIAEYLNARVKVASRD